MSPNVRVILPPLLAGLVECRRGIGRVGNFRRERERARLSRRVGRRTRMRTGRTSGSCCRYAATRGWPVESEACLEGLPRRLLGRTGRADRVEEGVSSEADLGWHWMRCECAPVRAWPGELKRRDSVDKVSLPLCVGWREETVVGSFPHFFLRPRAVHSIQHGTTHDSTHHRHIPIPTPL